MDIVRRGLPYNCSDKDKFHVSIFICYYPHSEYQSAYSSVLYTIFLLSNYTCVSELLIMYLPITAPNHTPEGGTDYILDQLQHPYLRRQVLRHQSSLHTHGGCHRLGKAGEG